MIGPWKMDELEFEVPRGLGRPVMGLDLVGWKPGQLRSQATCADGPGTRNGQARKKNLGFSVTEAVECLDAGCCFLGRIEENKRTTVTLALVLIAGQGTDSGGLDLGRFFNSRRYNGRARRWVDVDSLGSGLGWDDGDHALVTVNGDLGWLFSTLDDFGESWLLEQALLSQE